MPGTLLFKNKIKTFVARKLSSAHASVQVWTTPWVGNFLLNKFLRFQLHGRDAFLASSVDFAASFLRAIGVGGFRTWTWKSIQSTSTNMSFGSLGTNWGRLNCDKMCSLHIFVNVLRSQTCQSSPKCFHHHWTNGNFLINVCAFALLGNP